MYNNSYETYRHQSVMTMTQGEMLVKLYDETIKQLGSAVRSIQERDISATNNALQKAQKILTYLDNTLDRSYEISTTLSALYDFFIRQAVAANVEKNAEPLNQIIPMVTELRDTFVQAEKLARMSQRSAAGSTDALMSAVG